MILNAIAETLKRRSKSDFKGRHFEASLILQAVCWNLRYPLSFRDIEELFLERGLAADHATLNRWVLAYAPLIEHRLRAFHRCWGGGRAGPGADGRPNRLRTPSGQVPGEVLVHLEHGHLVLAEDALELVVGQNLTAVLGVLQVMGLDVVPDLAQHLAPGQWSWADYRGQRFRQLQRPLQRVRLAAACSGLRLLRRLLRYPGWHRPPPICAAILARAAPGAVCASRHGQRTLSSTSIGTIARWRSSSARCSKQPAFWACRKVFPRPICKGVALCRTCFDATKGRNSAVWKPSQ